MTFYARIDNEGSGGSSEDIEVRFLVSQGINGKQTEISKEKVTADIPFALGTAAFNNSDFSGDTFTCTGLPTCSGSDTLNDWFILGEVFAESRCTLDDKQCPEKIIALPDTPNLKQCGYESYARLYGNTILRSNATFEKRR
ncbi:MAG: hypothetical protein OMM_01270 [Candidatus Magnetoglobus multicellularis str. Araruama]|uniref:CARDB domain-containing protein n=1 Tax=Candidatus Magnetoglobus multicellularis str. Araruama TaxID=890399 RepID=A0A1V1PEC7_9BACT|nr:MAG: hypothetical protein OMM_01270 [Candidatus Magnetoglobus multicellularis str. Araruama]